MAFGVSWLDILLVVLFVGLLFYVSGLRKGLFVTLGGIAGFVAGGVATFFAIPLVSSWVQDAGWRLFWVVATAVVLMLLGHGIGVAIGARIRLGLNFPALRSCRPPPRRRRQRRRRRARDLRDRLLRRHDGRAPALAADRGLAGHQDHPRRDPGSRRRRHGPGARHRHGADASPSCWSPSPPSTTPGPPPRRPRHRGPEARRGVGREDHRHRLRLRCQPDRARGSPRPPTVSSPTRTLSPASTEPVVNTRDGGALPASVVHFDTATDLAVLAVEGLGLDPIPVGEDLAKGDSGAFLGYPAGGPFSSEGATVQSLRTVMVQNIYGADPSPLEESTSSAPRSSRATRAGRCWVATGSSPASSSPRPRATWPWATPCPSTRSNPWSMRPPATSTPCPRVPARPPEPRRLPRVPQATRTPAARSPPGHLYATPAPAPPAPAPPASGSQWSSAPCCPACASGTPSSASVK